MKIVIFVQTLVRYRRLGRTHSRFTGPVPESRGLGFGRRAVLTAGPEPVEHFPLPRPLGIV